ncbi:diguanylate cyclase (GGDEF) domain-containing protein [Malonomonas rubra DSM 5091]|uniref:diguanylate cyclase n=1 Tax=Malonomonas rubra DSM 5091 TaxID=1122189 RepID=A0A1M6DPU6_MALRU|nr:diguanylate cyclase [Malonomonas rubra]SHI75212.1 diguanylate cyclase (GGDEF) domain-containing protein [Malonomonas rubra DSM 5091]
MDFDLPKLMIVDDEETTRLILKNIFKKDYQLIICANGEDALLKAKSERPDLILLDIMMPGIDGYGVAQHLYEDVATKNIPIIFLTALDGVNDEVQGLKIGAVDYVTKPIQPEIVRLRVGNHLMLKRQASQLKRQAEQLALLADLDGLTGIMNRRALDRELQRELNRAARAELPIGLLMIDIDYFKSYNDTYGHLVGDRCLQKVAHCLQNFLPRRTDIIARYGGEEFCCVLFNTDFEGMELIATRLAKAVSDLQIPHAGSGNGEYLSISIGGCSIDPMSLTRPEDIISCADQHLYQAKHSGRAKISLCHNAEVCSENYSAVF